MLQKPMRLDLMLLAALLGLSLLNTKTLETFKRRKKHEWIIDAVSLGCYFILVPAAQIAIGYSIYAFLIPQFKGALILGWMGSLFALLITDYIWYWNHRLFRAQTPLWRLHTVHHESKELDFFASQRNSVWSFPFMIYFWVSRLILFLAKDPFPFLTLASVGALINFWGHTNLFVAPGLTKRIFSLFLIQPENHFWHHSAENPNCNFATLFNFWDKLHGNWYSPGTLPTQLGYESKMPLWRKVIFPVDANHG
ncbi:MAG: sterol desaturase family protein [Bdellovibrionales bacterium]|nr:sterol desaturase family protein [Oligoflexia bacterium]